MKVEVCFQIDQEKFEDAMRRMAELIEGADAEEELAPLYDAIRDPESTEFEVEEE